MSEPVRFAEYLISSGKNEDAAYVLEKGLAQSSSHDKDSIYYLLGKVHYNNHMTDSAIKYLSLAEFQSENEHFKSLCVLFINQLQLFSDSAIRKPLTDTGEFHEIYRIQLLANRLLANDIDSFNVVFNQPKCEIGYLASIEFNLYLKALTVDKFHPRRSKFLAAMISSALPGLGKVYAGKPNEGLTAAIPVVSNGIQAAEGFYYMGFNSPHFYIFGAIGLVFHLSNIYGSVKAVKRNENDKKNLLEHEVHQLMDTVARSF